MNLDLKSHYSTIEIDEYVAGIYAPSGREKTVKERLLERQGQNNIQECTTCKQIQPGQEPEPKGALVVTPEALAQSPGCRAHRRGRMPRGSQGPRWEGVWVKQSEEVTCSCFVCKRRIAVTI